MVFTVRLDGATKKRLDDLARASGRSRSEIVREAIRRYDLGDSTDVEVTVLEQLADIIGIAAIGGRRARDGETILREAFARKRRSP